MSAGPKLPLAEARRVAEDLLASTRLGVERAAIAGSIRRQKPKIGDIELVVIPRPSLDLFGAPLGSVLELVLDELVMEGRLVPLKSGAKFRQYRILEKRVTNSPSEMSAAALESGAVEEEWIHYVCNLDLFIVSKETWGVQFLIRTGPAEYSHRFVMQRAQGGMLPPYWRVQGGLLLDERGSVLATPEEADVYRAIGLPFVPPEERR